MIDDVVKRATHRLRDDRELQLDVAHELQTHLDSAVGEYRRAGYGDDDARQAAAKDLGDPDDLAADLWQANRFRMRLRSIAWWIARATLLPACIIATAWFLFTGIASQTMMTEFTPRSGGFYSALARRWVEQRINATMTPQQWLIFYGDHAAPTLARRWQALRDAHPNEPLYQLNYINAIMSDEGSPLSTDPNPQVLDPFLAELERGKPLDPDNGIYAYLRAVVMLHEVKLVNDESHSVLTLNADGTRSPSYPTVFADGTAPAGLDEALVLLRAAATHRHLSLHTLDMLRHRIEQLPPPRSMREYVYRVSQAISMLLPTLSHQRHVARVLSTQAIRLADQGDGEGALALMDLLQRITQMQSAAAETLIEILVAQSTAYIELVTRVQVHQALGDETAAAQAQEAMDAHYRRFRELWYGDPQAAQVAEKVKRAGVLLSQLMPAVPGYDVDVASFRKAEYTLLDRGALATLLLLLVVLAMLCGTVGLWRLARTPEAARRPVLLWPGWRRYARVMALAVLLPVALFAVFTATPWSGRQWGLNYHPAAAFWHAPLIVLMLLLIWNVGSSMLRRRAAEVGMAVPTPLRWWIEALLALGMAALLGWAVLFSWGRLAQRNASWGLPALLWSGLVLALWGQIGWQIVWMHGVDRPTARLARGLLLGLAVGTGVAAFLSAVVWLTVPSIDRGAFVVVASLCSLVGGLLAGWLWLPPRQGRTRWFAVSATRSMTPLFAGAGLLLAVTVGALLHWHEAMLAAEMVEQSQVFVDLEIDRSDAKLLRADLAQGAPRPPRLPR